MEPAFSVLRTFWTVVTLEGDILKWMLWHYFKRAVKNKLSSFKGNWRISYECVRDLPFINIKYSKESFTWLEIKKNWYPPILFYTWQKFLVEWIHFNLKVGNSSVIKDTHLSKREGTQFKINFRGLRACVMRESVIKKTPLYSRHTKN